MSTAPKLDANPAAAGLQLLASTTRLRILQFVATNGPTRVTPLSEALGLPLQTVSSHVQILDRHGLIVPRFWQDPVALTPWTRAVLNAANTRTAPTTDTQETQMPSTPAAGDGSPTPEERAAVAELGIAMTADPAFRTALSDIALDQVRAASPGSIRAALTAAGINATDDQLAGIVELSSNLVIDIDWPATFRTLRAATRD